LTKQSQSHNNNTTKSKQPLPHMSDADGNTPPPKTTGAFGEVLADSSLGALVRKHGQQALTDFLGALPSEVATALVTNAISGAPSAGAPGAAPKANNIHADASTGAALVAHFHDSKMRSIEPWRDDRERFEVVLESINAMPRADKCKTVLTRAKHGLLTTHDVMSLTYMLYGSGDSSEVYAGIMLRSDGVDRIKNHNWYVAIDKGEAFCRLWGHAIEQLTLPLFPPTPEFDELNEQLLLQAVVQPDAPVGGGESAASKAYSKFFKPTVAVHDKPRPAAKASKKPQPLSGGYIPFAVASDGHGGHAVDMQPVSDTLQTYKADMDRQRSQIDSLRKEVAALKQLDKVVPNDLRAERGRGAGRGAWQQRGRGKALGGGDDDDYSYHNYPAEPAAAPAQPALVAPKLPQSQTQPARFS
jgi:hypothetical protein